MMKRITTLLLSALLALPAFAQIPLALSTASQAVKFGPFVDSTDGNTEETALTIANTDIKCSKNGGTLASKNSGGGTHDANGWYTVTFDATDTNTAGRLTCFVHVSGALPVFREFTVGPVSVNAAQVGGQTASASGTVTFPNATLASTTNITAATVDVIKWNGTTVATPDTAGYPKITIKDGTGTGEIDTNAGAVVAVTTTTTATNLTNLPAITSNWLTATGIASNAFTDAKFDTTAGAFYAQGVIDQGTAQSATGTTIVLRSAANFTADSSVIGATVLITGGTGAGQSRAITAYVNSTDTATVATWTTNPDNTSTYKVFGTAPGSASSLDATAVENAVWNSARASHVTSGTFGENVIADTTKFGGTAGTFSAGVPAVNTTKVGGTTQTARDLGASVLLSTGTGTGQLDFTSGVVKANPVQWNGTTVATPDTAGYPKVTIKDGTGTGEIDTNAGAVVAVTTTTTATNLTNLPAITSNWLTAAGIASDADTEIGASVNTAQGVLTGTCDSGSTTTCVDDALTQASASQLNDRLICFDDQFCGLISFNAGTDTVTLLDATGASKAAPSTRASKVYTIYPATK